MVYGDFGIKLFFDRNLLLTSSSELVHFGYRLRRESSVGSHTNVYFYIKDDEICQKNEDCNYVSNVTELSHIPIYQGNTPGYCLWNDDIVRQKLIDESKLCIYFYHVNRGLKFFVHFIYKDCKYDIEISEKVLSLLKYTWFESQTLSLEDMEELGEDIYKNLTSINVYKIVNELKIISGEKVFYGRDSESTHSAERWIIDTNDFYILNTLNTLSKKLFPRSFNEGTHCMYGTHSTKEYNSFYLLEIETKLNIINSVIDKKINGSNLKDCIRYFFLRNYLLKKLPFNKESIQCCELDEEFFEKEKTSMIISQFINNYNIGKHMAVLFYIQSEAIKVPSEMMNKTVDAYNKWLQDNIKSSSIENITIYFSEKDVCEEFNKHSNERFNFGLDFSLFEKNSPI